MRLTADGEPILLHDDRLGTTTDGRGRVCNLPAAIVRGCDAGARFDRSFAGERVPSLAEALAVLGQLGLGANVELKADRRRAAETGAVAALTLARLWPPHLPAPLISSFLPRTLAAARETAPQIARGLLFAAVPRDWRKRVRALECVSVHADHRRLCPAVVAEIREWGYPVLAYTVNRAAQARKLYGWGVASVFSDVPDIIDAVAPPPRFGTAS